MSDVSTVLSFSAYSCFSLCIFVPFFFSHPPRALQVAGWLEAARGRVVVLTGAGTSAESGIPMAEVTQGQDVETAMQERLRAEPMLATITQTSGQKGAYMGQQWPTLLRGSLWRCC